jgi:hypothetical protein
MDPSELREITGRYGGLSYNVVKWSVCRSIMVQSKPRHTYTNKAVVQISSLGWLFLLRLMQGLAF